VQFVPTPFFESQSNDWLFCFNVYKGNIINAFWNRTSPTL